MPVVPNVSLHHEVDANIRRDTAENHRQFATPHDDHDVQTQASQLSLPVLNGKVEHASQDTSLAVGTNPNGNLNRRNPLERVERINWKIHAETIMAAAHQPELPLLTQRKRTYEASMCAGTTHNHYGGL